MGLIVILGTIFLTDFSSNIFCDKCVTVLDTIQVTKFESNHGPGIVPIQIVLHQEYELGADR